MSILDRTSVVLVEPQEPLNVGTAVRAAYNMGIHDVRLVQPDRWDPARAAITAPGLGEVVTDLPCYGSARDAIADGVLAIGFTSRPRKGRYQVWELERFGTEVPARLPPGDGRLHLLFGREDFGLPNEVLDICDGYVRIGSDPAYHSLNVAQAVLLGCYAIRRATAEPLDVGPRSEYPSATSKDIDGLMSEIRSTLTFIEFFKYEGADKVVLRSVRGLLGRTALDQREVRLIRGIFAEVVGFCRRKGLKEKRTHGKHGGSAE